MMLAQFVVVMLLSFAAMEWVAWAMHRYVMHGLLWVLHRDHHRRERHGLQRNDAFFVIFAIPSWLSIMLGSMRGSLLSVAVGSGIALYGLCYFLVHEVFIHKRLKFWRTTHHVYWLAVRKAHMQHHRHLTQEDGERFGLLWVTRQDIAEARQALSRNPR
jgi:beta-carotene 3-hydroxylase